jgi:ABC-type transporter Mla subunit MlaD
MPLQDLTPQLRTRLSRLESVVGWFVLLAAMLLVAGFVYYVVHTAQRKGWFQEKVLFSTFVNTATGLKPGDPVRLMGFPIGEVTRVVPNDPNFQYGNITIFFVVRRDANHYCGYLWSDSRAKVVPTDFLGNRGLEITKGQTGIPLLRLADPADPRSPIAGRLDVAAVKKFTAKVAASLGTTNPPTAEEKEIHAFIQKVSASPWEYSAKGYVESPDEMAALVVQAIHREQPNRFYVPYDKDKDIFIEPEESPALTERLERIITQAERALPSFLTLTNQLAQALDNAVRATAELESLLTNTRPAVLHAGELTAELQQAVRDLRPMFTNLARISETLAQPQGSLGEWLLPTNVHRELLTVLRSASTTLDTANTAIGNTDTNLETLIDHVNLTLENLALMTSNLNRQVEANTNILSDISDLIRNTDQFIQGLRRHWLLRSAFRTNRPPSRPQAPATPPPPAALPPRLKP